MAKTEKIIPASPPPRVELSDNPVKLCNEIARLFRGKMREREDAEGVMTQPGAHLVLAFLASGDGTTQLELVHSTHLKAPTVSVILKKMEEEGIVRRECDKNDGRAVRVFLTEHGREIDREHIKLIKERTVELGGGVYNHTNIYGFPYDVGYDKGKLTKYLFKFQKKYFVAYRLSLDSPRVEEEEFKPIYLIDRFWGFPGLIKKVRQGEKKLDFTIENTLLEIEKRTNNLSEAEKIFLSEDLDFSDFFNDIFGDG